MIQIVVSKSVRIRIRIMKLRSDGKKEHWKKSVPNKIYSRGEASGWEIFYTFYNYQLLTIYILRKILKFISLLRYIE